MHLAFSSIAQITGSIALLTLMIVYWARQRGPGLSRMPFEDLVDSTKRHYTRHVRPYLGGFIRKRDKKDPIETSIIGPFIKTWDVQFESTKEHELSTRKVRIDMCESLGRVIQMAEKVCLEKSVDFEKELRIVEKKLEERAKRTEHRTDEILHEELGRIIKKNEEKKIAKTAEIQKGHNPRRPSLEVILDSWVGMKLEHIGFIRSVLIEIGALCVKGGKLEIQDRYEGNFASFVRAERIDQFASFLKSLKKFDDDKPVTKGVITKLSRDKTTINDGGGQTVDIRKMFDDYKKGLLHVRKTPQNLLLNKFTK